jgi:tetratricopeptide (TPR) repeat protein
MPSLDQLFEQLHAAQDEAHIHALQDQIWQQWLATGNPSLDYLIKQGNRAISRQDLRSAIDYFTQVIEQAPELSEGWNKRATAYYLRGNFKAAIDDIEATLQREPRHFGALSGLAAIYITIGDLQRALATSERLQAIIPNDADTLAQIQELRLRLGIDSGEA